MNGKDERGQQPPVPGEGSPAQGSGAPAVRVAGGAAREFLDGVRAALSDLPPGEVDEILDDVRAHLAELSGELGEDPDRAALTARLGTPQAYAGELRSAAGYPPPPPAAGPAAPDGRITARLAVLGLLCSTVVAPLALLSGSEIGVVLGLLGVPLALPALFREGPRMTAVAELPELQGVLAAIRRTRSGFLGDLQSAWWVLRALAAAVLVAWVFVQSEAVAAVLLAVVAVPVSVWLGRLTRTDRRWLWLVLPLNALAAAVVLLLAFRAPTPAYEAADYPSSPDFPGLVQDGETILDIRPVDAAGNPLTGVYLFTQDGKPIEVDGAACYDAEDDPYGAGAPADEGVRPYPRGTWQWDPTTGRCALVPPAPLVVAVPTDAATSPTPGATAPSAAPPVVPTAAPTAGPPEATPSAVVPPTATPAG